MKFIETEIKGVYVVEPQVFVDSRGFFFEAYSKDMFDKGVGCKVDFVQDNQSRSIRGVIRGLHFQRGRHAQAKLVSCIEGRVLDVAVDLRPGSPTLYRYVAVELSAENHRSLFIPRGFAHGFAVLSDTAVFQYKCDNYYCPQAEGGISILDPKLRIDWKINFSEAILSDKDFELPFLSKIELPWTADEIS